MFSFPPCFRLILTFCCYFYGFLRELDIAFGRPPDRVETHSFHRQTRWANLAPDINDAMELWALEPHMILVKVISVCGLHVFFHQYVVDLRERKSENVFRTVSTSSLMFHMTVLHTSGAITMPPEVPVIKILPLTTVFSFIDAVSTVTLFVVPPSPDIGRPVMQAQDFSNCREFISSFRLSASSPAPMLPRDSAKDSSPFLSLGRVPPLRGDKSPPAEEALLQPPADDCVVSGVDVPNTVGRCELFPGSESLCSLPACATVRSVLLAGPSGASDWVSFQNLYDTAGGIIDLCNARDPGGGLIITVWTAESSIQILRVRRSAVYQWKLGITIAAPSYSAPRQRRDAMSGVVPSPVSACRSCFDLEYCSVHPVTRLCHSDSSSP